MKSRYHHQHHYHDHHRRRRRRCFNKQSVTVWAIDQCSNHASYFCLTGLWAHTAPIQWVQIQPPSPHTPSRCGVMKESTVVTVLAMGGGSDDDDGGTILVAAYRMLYRDCRVWLPIWSDGGSPAQ